MMRRRHRSLIRAQGILACLAFLAACSGDSPLVVDSNTIGGQVTTVDAVDTLGIRLVAQFGEGRAVTPHPTADGLVVVTTAGVAIVDAEGTVDVVDNFEAGAEPRASAISPDGSRLAVWTIEPSAVHWYDLSTRRRIGTGLVPGGSFINDLAIGIGEDDATLASTGDGIVLWRDAGGTPPESLLDGAVAAGRGALVDGGRFVVALAGTNDLAVVGDGPPQLVKIPPGAPRDVATSSEGTTVAVVTSIDGADALEGSDSIVVFDAATFDVLGEVPIDGRVGPQDWALEDEFVAVSNGTTATTYALDGSTIAEAASTHTAPIAELLATPTEVITIDRSGGVSIASAETGAGTVVDDGGTAIVDVSVDAAEDVLVATDFYGRLLTWDLETGVATVDDVLAVGELTSVAAAPDSDRIGVASTNGTVTVLDSTLAPVSIVAVRDDPVRVDTVEFLPSSGEMVTGLAERVGDLAFDDSVTLWDGDDARFRIGGESEDVGGCAFFYNRVRFSPDSKLLAVTSHDFSVALVDTDSGTVVHQFPPETSGVLDIAFTPDGAYLVVTNDAASVSVWDIAERELAAQYPASMGGYQAIAMIPGATATMATVDVAGTIVVVDVMTGEPLRTFDGIAGRTTSLAISPDGSLIAAPSGSSGLSLWSVDSGAVLAEIPAHHASVTDLAFSPDGAVLLSASRDGTARRWQLARST